MHYLHHRRSSYTVFNLRSIQAEGAFGTIKWNRAYTRARRRGLNGLILEMSMISCGFNLHKYHLKTMQSRLAA
ncbi:MAG: transposase [Clostridia bacterium]|nr:transposase [Clostridia bacterium]